MVSGRACWLYAGLVGHSRAESLEGDTKSHYQVRAGHLSLSKNLAVEAKAFEFLVSGISHQES